MGLKRAPWPGAAGLAAKEASLRGALLLFVFLSKQGEGTFS